MCQDRTDDMLETHFTCKGKKYPVIGLTGGVGAGKSTVLSILQEKYGFHVIQLQELLWNREKRLMRRYAPF